MFTIALVGPDGAGKTTVARTLESSFPLPVKYLYMGVSPLSSNYALPTTWVVARIKRLLGKNPDMAGPRDPTRGNRIPKSRLKRIMSSFKATLRMMNRVAEEWYRLTVARHYRRRGYIVLFDRDFFADYYAYDVAHPASSRPLSSRIHGFLLDRLYPIPDLMICLDAPASVLYARKKEGSLEYLECRRQEYLALGKRVHQFALVDASRPMDEVIQEVARLICDFCEIRVASR